MSGILSIKNKISNKKTKDRVKKRGYNVYHEIHGNNDTMKFHENKKHTDFQCRVSCVRSHRIITIN